MCSLSLFLSCTHTHTHTHTPPSPCTHPKLHSHALFISIALTRSATAPTPSALSLVNLSRHCHSCRCVRTSMCTFDHFFNHPCSCQATPSHCIYAYTHLDVPCVSTLPQPTVLPCSPPPNSPHSPSTPRTHMPQALASCSAVASTPCDPAPQKRFTSARLLPYFLSPSPPSLPSALESEPPEALLIACTHERPRQHASAKGRAQTTKKRARTVRVRRRPHALTRACTRRGRPGPSSQERSRHRGANATLCTMRAYSVHLGRLGSVSHNDTSMTPQNCASSTETHLANLHRRLAEGG